MEIIRQQDCSYGVIPVKKENDTILFLLIHHYAGHWGFPKGHKEKGENDEQSALRELEEEGCVSECNVVPDIWFEDRYIHLHNGIDCEKTVRYFLGIVVAESAPHDDPDGGVVERKWVTYDTAFEMLTYLRHKEIVQSVKEYIDSHPDIFI